MTTSGILELAPGLPAQLDLSPYLNVQRGDGMDPANPSFTQKVFSHALLKEGGVQALESFQLREMQFPMRLRGDQVSYTNLVPNPSFEHDTLGGAPAAWSAASVAGNNLNNGATLTVVASPSQFGDQALEVTTTSGAAAEGATVQVLAASAYSPGQTYTANIWLRGVAGGEQVQLVLGSTAYYTTSTANVTLTTGWQLYSVTWTAPGGSGSEPIFFSVRTQAATACSWYQDGALCVSGSYMPAYFDGDLAGYWNGTPGNSTSSNYYLRDGVAALLERINTLVNTSGMTVAWQDQGSTRTTYFDLAAGQFDLEYDFREAGNYILSGKLRLFVQPLGRTATMRLVASAAGTGPVLLLPVASPIIGDVGALMQAQISPASAILPPHQVALSVLPAGYVPEFRAANMIATDYTSNPAVPTLVGASGAVASQTMRVLAPAGAANPGGLLGQVQLPTITPYLGVNRVLAVMRLGAFNATCAVQAQLNSSPDALFAVGAQTLPTTIVGPVITGATPWVLVDLGTFTVPSSLAYPTAPYLSVSARYLASLAATANIDLSDIIIIPDGQTVYCSGGALNTNYSPLSYTIDGVANEMWAQNTGATLSAGFVKRLTGDQRGPIPKLPIVASQTVAVVVLSGNLAPANVPANQIVSASIQVRERVRFAF